MRCCHTSRAEAFTPRQLLGLRPGQIKQETIHTSQSGSLVCGSSRSTRLPPSKDSTAAEHHSADSCDGGGGLQFRGVCRYPMSGRSRCRDGALGARLESTDDAHHLYRAAAVPVCGGIWSCLGTQELLCKQEYFRASVSRSTSDAINLKVLRSFFIMVPMILGCGIYEECMRLERLAPNGVQA